MTAGLNTVLVPLYVSEVAPVGLRGGLGVLNQLAVTSGIFMGQVGACLPGKLATGTNTLTTPTNPSLTSPHLPAPGQVLGLGAVLGNPGGWPWLLAITCLPPVLQLALLWVTTYSHPNPKGLKLGVLKFKISY